MKTALSLVTALTLVFFAMTSSGCNGSGTTSASMMGTVVNASGQSVPNFEATFCAKAENSAQGEPSEHSFQDPICQAITTGADGTFEVSANINYASDTYVSGVSVYLQKDGAIYPGDAAIGSPTFDQALVGKTLNYLFRVEN